MTPRTLNNLAVLTVPAVMAATTQAQPILSLAPPPAPAKPAEATGLEKTIQDLKAPCQYFNWGGDMRLRNEYFNNVFTLGDDNVGFADSAGNNHSLHEQDFFRFRGRLWASVLPTPNLSLNTRVAAEPRLFMNPAVGGTYRNSTGMEWKYGLVDVLNLQWKNIGDLPLTLTAGRQDIFMGEQLNYWLVGDGTPLDGSWTFFLDAIRLTYEMKDIKTKFDAMYIYQNAYGSEWLPTLNTGQNDMARLTESNEKGVGFFVSNKSLPKANLDAYFIYKQDQAKYAFGDFGNVYTLGGKVSGPVTEHFEYAAEGAYQFGNKEFTGSNGGYTGAKSTDYELGAFGLNSRVTYLLKDPLKNRFRMSFEYLSGDDRGTPGRNEGFDILWGRYPRFSELFAPNASETGRPGQFGNLIRFGPAWEITPMKNLDYHLEYTPMFAEHQFSNPLTSTGSPAGLPGAAPGGAGFGDGYFRGHYMQTWLKYKFNQHLSGHLWGEFIWAGDYYRSANLWSFLRAEVLMTF